MLPWIVVDVAVKLAVVGLSLYPLARRSASHFQGKAMGARAVAYPAAMLLIPLAWVAAGQPSAYPVAADILVGIPFLVDALANVLGLFAIERFDVVPHFVGWFCLATAFGLAVNPMLDVRWVGFGLALGFGAVLDVVWEIAEFLFSRLGSSGLQLTYENTIQDLAMSLSGAATGALFGASVLWPAAGTPASLFGWA